MPPRLTAWQSGYLVVHCRYWASNSLAYSFTACRMIACGTSAFGISGF